MHYFIVQGFQCWVAPWCNVKRWSEELYRNTVSCPCWYVSSIHCLTAFCLSFSIYKMQIITIWKSRCKDSVRWYMGKSLASWRTQRRSDPFPDTGFLSGFSVPSHWIENRRTSPFTLEITLSLWFFISPLKNIQSYTLKTLHFLFLLLLTLSFHLHSE